MSKTGQIKKLIIYTDGAARGNPGPAGVGVVITTPVLERQLDNLQTYYQYLGEATNNQAEYKAVIAGLELAKKWQAEEIEIKLDSQLVAAQMNKEYKVKDDNLAKLFVKVWNLTQSFRKVNFRYIPREKNKLADKLANQAIDEKK